MAVQPNQQFNMGIYRVFYLTII